MCGIYGYVGKLNAVKEVYSGLELLQYRGYDSCGIAYLDKKLKIIKSVGTLQNLKPKIEGIKRSYLAFGHTRWATNGEVNLDNTHPHVSMNGEFVVVHNGIIRNSEGIKQKLIETGYKFYSQTDTEVIANLIESLSGDVEERLKQLFSILEGSFALIIGHGDVLYLVKQFSPLNVVTTQDGIYISSDLSSLKSGKAYVLNDGDIIKVENGEIIPIISKRFALFEHTSQISKLNCNGFDSFMRKEIFDSPNAILDTFDYLKKQNIKKIFKGIKKLTFVACGTAYHSCLIGKYCFSKLNFDLEDYLATNYIVSEKIKHNHLHIIVSQSGETADCIKVAESVKKCGGKLLLITNQEMSSLTKFADFCLFTRAGKELAVASTKTYSAQVFCFIYMAGTLKNQTIDRQDVLKITNQLKLYLNSLDMRHLAEKLEETDKLILIAREIDYLTILEASLKIREIDYIFTLPMYSGELKHGTLSLIEEDSVVLSLNTSQNKNKLRTAINEICSRSGIVIEMENYLPKDIDERFVSIFAIIPFQLLSLEISVVRGRNPDMPRNLAKSVTVE